MTEEDPVEKVPETPLEKAAAGDNRYASQEWVKNLAKQNPSLVGDLGRPPTREELRIWKRRSKKHKQKLILLKLRYLRSGLKEHMRKYLGLRRKCGYVEGVPVPAWLMKVGST